mmetsp:Transcript_22318/g.30565  ORF Transcript_22318/g.30565 Transcript_22318/m.30565 type:complete len:215 (-) Transcript_22318:127-771(-)
MFHKRHPLVNLAVNVTRHPFSFRGSRPLDDPSMEVSIQQGDTLRLSSYSSTLQRLGDAAGISFHVDRSPYYNPLDSQRALLWAARYGKQEELAEVLSRNHFEKAMSSSFRSNVLKAIEETNELNLAEAKEFLSSNELVEIVLNSYKDNVHLHQIVSIPLVIFNLPQCGIEGGPFRSSSLLTTTRRAPWIKQGSNTPEAFLLSFESMYSEFKRMN